jgi:hypothetical protein
MWNFLFRDPFQDLYDEVESLTKDLFSQLTDEYKLLDFTDVKASELNLRIALTLLRESPSVRFDNIFYYKSYEKHLGYLRTEHYDTMKWGYMRVKDDLEMHRGWKYIVRACLQIPTLA